MANLPPNELYRPHLDQLSGLSEPGGMAEPEEIERRAQELINEWLTIYFSGNSFATPTPSGTNEYKEFAACTLHFGQSTPESPQDKPLLHTLLADRRDGEGIRVPGNLVAHTGTWTWNTLVRISPQLPAKPGNAAALQTNARLAAKQAAQRIGDQFRWLVQSVHARDLCFKGFSDITVLNGPRPLQAGAWNLSQIVWSAKVTYHMVG